VRVQRGDEVWVATGDYKRDPDPSCEPFEIVPCHTLITEATFGTPKYVWDRSRQIGNDIHRWWISNATTGKNSVLFGYSLGKAQRILAELAAHAQREVIIHRTMLELTECYRHEGRALAPTRCLDEVAGEIQGELLLIPPQALDDGLSSRLGAHETAFASGWMQDQKPGSPYRGGKGYDRGFVISDHADWTDLNRTIDECGARRVFVQHRGMGALVRHLRARGIEAYPSEWLEPERFAKIAPANLELFR
jgi:putative mRNA 3-end processing factor